jgi:EAL domain-containing protein (putative c-di-GMP-specific phosphodiesterase class I)
LRYIGKLPPDTPLAIGRPERLSLVSTIINLAHSLGLNEVAEGVETEEQSRLLRLLNCDQVQRFLFTKPSRARPSNQDTWPAFVM